MTARQHVAATLKSIQGLRGVYFVERPSDGQYPCAVYSPAGNLWLDEIRTPGATYASWFSVEVRASSSGKAEMLAEKVLIAFRQGGRMERRRDLSFLYDDADAAPAGGSREAYGVYRALSGYLIREGG